MITSDQILFASRIRNMVWDYHRLCHASRPDSMQFEHQLLIARNIWNEFAYEPSPSLNVDLLLQMSDPFLVLVYGLYEHLFSFGLHPTDPLIDDEKAIASINNYLAETVFSKPFQDSLQAESKATRKRRDSIKNYLMAKKSIYRRLLIVRIDFGYRKAIDITLQKLQTAWDAQLEYVRKNYPSHVGYVVKFEYAPTKGLHAHCLFLFDGSKVINDARIARILGEYWRDEVTDGRGTYYNGNTDENKGKMYYPVIGLITEADGGFEKGVNNLATYFAKADPQIHFYIPPNSRILRKGQLTEAEQAKIKKNQSKRSLLQDSGESSSEPRERTGAI